LLLYLNAFLCYSVYSRWTATRTL